jgi:zinc/manganese transport system permease protein
MAALVGWLMVLRRQSFAGHTLSAMSFPGAAGAALLGVAPALGYYTFCLAGAVAIAAVSGRRAWGAYARESAAIGVVQAFALALGFLFLSLYEGVLEGLETLLFGSFLGISRGEVLTLLLVAVAVLAALAALGRPLLFVSIDEPVARAAGVPAGALSLAFLLVLGLAVAATAQITGALLVFALLVAPAAAARALTCRIGLGLALSVALALLVTWVGLGLSFFTNRPVGFFITTLAFAVFALARAARAARTLSARRGRHRPAAVLG